MKIMYEVGDKVIITNTSGVYNFVTGDVVKVVGVNDSAFSNRNAPYLITDGKESEWVYDYNIEPATVSLLCKWNETELKEYIKIKTEEDTKKCLEFLAKNPDEYFSLEEICKKAMISFSFIGTLQRELKKESENPFSCLNTDFYYKVSRILKPNKKVYFGDDGSILIRGRSEEYFNVVKVVREVYIDNDEEEREEDE